MMEVERMDVLPYKAIGNHLRTARKQLKLTQTEVAQRSFVSANYYGRIERGIARPSIDTLIVICGSLHLQMQEVFKGVDLLKEDWMNHKLGKGDFMRFCETMNETCGTRKKLVMMTIWRLIEDLDDK